MSFNHEAIAANPVSGNVDKAAQRAMFTRRYTYNLSAAELASDFVAVDPATGVLPLYLRQNNVTYQYDSTDSSTAFGAGVCLVTNDGKRYKAETIDYPHSVLDKDTTAQPATPTEGDRYIIPNAATGTDWSGEDGKIGIFVGGAWHFATVPIGVFVYVQDETAFYHRNASGNWTAGTGSITLGAGSVTMPMVLGAKASFVIKVENQTTTTAPASPVAPVAYIVAGSGGAWSGYSVGDLAMCMVNGSWTRIVPAAGDEVYDKSLAINYKRNSANTAWVSAAGAVIASPAAQFTVSGNTTTIGSGADYTFIAGTAPGTGNRHRRDNVGITHTARNSNSRLIFEYQAWITMAGAGLVSIMLLRDSESAALAHMGIYIPAGVSDVKSVKFEIPAIDDQPHTYKIAITLSDAGATGPTAIANRRFAVQEAV